jgi:hypothetical protein
VLLARAPDLDAVICATDVQAIGCCSNASGAAGQCPTGWASPASATTDREQVPPG